MSLLLKMGMGGWEGVVVVVGLGWAGIFCCYL